MHPSPITDACDNFAAPPNMKQTGFDNADQYQLIAGLIPDEPNMKAEYNQGKSFTSVYLLFFFKKKKEEDIFSLLYLFISPPLCFSSLFLLLLYLTLLDFRAF